MKEVSFKDALLIVTIVSLPILFYLHRLAPDTAVWKTSLFSLGSMGWESVRLFLWIVLTKIVTITLLSLWFITCKHWWRLAILVPLVIESFKLGLFLFNYTIGVYDELDYINSLPITIPLIIAIFFLSKKLNYYSLNKDIINEINIEIEILIEELSLLDQAKLEKGKEKLKQIQSTRTSSEDSDYLKQLLALRKEIFDL